MRPTPAVATTAGSVRTDQKAGRPAAATRAISVSAFQEEGADLIAELLQVLLAEVVHQHDAQLVCVLDRRVDAGDKDELPALGQRQQAQPRRKDVDEQASRIGMRGFRADRDVVRLREQWAEPDIVERDRKST